MWVGEEGGRERIVPMPQIAEEALWEHLHERLPLRDPYASVPDRGNRGTGRMRKCRAMRQLARRAGIKYDFTLHTLRHSFTTFLIPHSDLRIIEELPVPADRSTTQV